jgi:hypothetical protein
MFDSVRQRPCFAVLVGALLSSACGAETRPTASPTTGPATTSTKAEATRSSLPPKPVLAIEARTFDVGGGHACRLVDGRAQCWGSNGQGQAEAPAGPFAQISLGTHHSCGLSPQGEISCWGDEEAAPPSGTKDVVFLEAFGASTCVLSAQGAMRCWGQVKATMEGVVAVRGHAGDAITVLTADSFRTIPSDEPPRPLPAGLDAKVALGSCVIAGDGRVRCWESGRPEPVVVEGQFVDLISGQFLVERPICAVDREGRAHCWEWSDGPQANRVKIREGTGWQFGKDASCRSIDGKLRCSHHREEFMRWYPGRSYVRVYADRRLRNRRLCLVSSEGSVDCIGTRDGDVYASAGNYRDPAHVSPAAGACVGACRTKWASFRSRRPEGSWASEEAYGGTAPVTCWLASGEARCEDGHPAPTGPATWVTTDGLVVCVLRPNGAIACEGLPSEAIPTGAGHTQPVISGGRVCALDRESRVRCGGKLRSSSKPHIDDGVELRSLFRGGSGYTELCGLFPDGSAACNGGPRYRDERPFVSFGSTGSHVCAVRDDGHLRCFGRNAVPPPL